MISCEVERVAKSNQGACGAGVAHGRVALVRVIMEAGTLEEAESYAPHLVLVHGAIGVQFDTENQLGRNGLGARRNFSHFINLLFHERAKLLVDR